MASGRLAAVSDYLLGLYSHSAEADAAAYSTFALEGLRDLLGADKAWWGVLSVCDAGPRLRSSFRSGLPPTWEAAWEGAKQDDSLARAMTRTRNRTLSLNAEDIPPASGLVRLAEGFDLGRTLSIGVDLPEPDAIMFVSLYRRHGRRGYTPADRSLNELLVQHLRAGWQQNLRERLRPGDHPSGAQAHRAFVDRESRLVQYEEGFAAAVARHWPAWRGPLLPLRLRDAVERARAEPGTWIGQGACSLRVVPAGLLTLVELREASLLDRLSPRELQVAHLFAAGATHKEVARLTELAPSTVRHYLREVYAKLEIDNKASLATAVGRSGEASIAQAISLRGDVQKLRFL